MKRFWTAAALGALLACLTCVSALGAVNDMLKVGLRYGSDALYSANLENYTGNGSGYSFGYFDEGRGFVSLGSTSYTTISMTQDGNIYVASDGTYSSTAPSGAFSVIGGYHVQLPGSYPSYESAQSAAGAYDGFAAYVGGTFYARVGSYSSYGEAQSAAAGYGGDVAEPSSTGVTVTVTGTTRILFQFDCYGARSLGVQPGGAANPVTWFKGYRYYGAFEYQRVTGGRINVINVVDLDDYVKGVIPYEMSGDWPLEALKAQAVCARTYGARTTKHLSSYGFDLCGGTDCQVYRGTASATSNSNRAVEETAGQCLYYNGSYIDAVYHASDGGATEDAANVWGGDTGYLIGKQDPYEGTISIPNYQYTVSYTPSQLTSILQAKGYSIGTIVNVYVSERTNMGNVCKVTFVDSSGKELTVSREACRTVFYSSTYNKSVRSMRFDIAGGSGGVPSSGCYVNNASNRLSSLSGAYTISGSGTVGRYSDKSAYVITSSGTSRLASPDPSSVPSGEGFTITGTGNGHNVGMSQYGAKAMAEQGYRCEDILQFYYTGVSIW
ncbi:SpoIID/LytB domain-containing protein [Dysosmobacter acutus]|nr:SpoIID/LytB domain-containing protein [Dysosmobacter acutus]